MTHELTDDELDALAQSPRAQMAAAVESVSPGDVSAVFARLTKSFRGFIDGFSAFVTGITEYVHTTHGFAAAGALDASVFAMSLREQVARGIDARTLARAAEETDVVAGVRTRLEAGDRTGALAIYDDYEASVRVVHDLAVGRVAAALTHVYRTFGVDELEACLRLCGERTLLGWMPHDLARPARVRVAQWARMMSGNFASIRVEETDDAFVITQNPCGTCARQVLDGCYAPPIDYAVVTESHALTWQRGDVPVYRTHVAVMHDLIPFERIGTRWPEITCPVGVSGGPCTVVLRK
jgi:hypothetical protein